MSKGLDSGRAPPPGLAVDTKVHRPDPSTERQAREPAWAADAYLPLDAQVEGRRSRGERATAVGSSGSPGTSGSGDGSWRRCGPAAHAEAGRGAAERPHTLSSEAAVVRRHDGARAVGRGTRRATRGARAAAAGRGSGWSLKRSRSARRDGRGASKVGAADENRGFRQAERAAEGAGLVRGPFDEAAARALWPRGTPVLEHLDAQGYPSVFEAVRGPDGASAACTSR
jgi:hypothetical protein